MTFLYIVAGIEIGLIAIRLSLSYYRNKYGLYRSKRHMIDEIIFDVNNAVLIVLAVLLATIAILF